MDVKTTDMQQLCNAHANMDQKNVSNTLLNLCHEELRLN